MTAGKTVVNKTNIYISLFDTCGLLMVFCSLCDSFIGYLLEEEHVKYFSLHPCPVSIKFRFVSLPLLLNSPPLLLLALCHIPLTLYLRDFRHFIELKQPSLQELNPFPPWVLDELKRFFLLPLSWFLRQHQAVLLPLCHCSMGDNSCFSYSSTFSRVVP